MGRTVFVMSGGGAKGSFELGALDYLIRDRGLDPAILVGVSTGTLNASILAQGRGRQGLLDQLERLESIWFGIRDERDIYRTRFGGVLGMIFKADSLYTNEPLWRLIKRHVDPQRLQDSGRVLRLGVVDLVAGDYSVIDGGHPQVLEMIRASASIPVFFTPVDLAGGRFVDGGVRDITPLSAAFDALAESARGDDHLDDPDTIYIILASPLREDPLSDHGKLDSGLDILKRSLSLLMNEVYANDLKMAALINESLRYDRGCEGNAKGACPYRKYRYADLVLIQPDRQHLGTLEFEPGKIRAAFEAGRSKAAEAVAAAEAGPDGSNFGSGDV